jgi:aspartate/methionine/tyrosine aminotransferase
MNILLNEGDEIITTFPSYQSLYEVARSTGCQVKHWKPRYKNGWKFHLEDLESLLHPGIKMLVINFPHNPTGCIISEDEQKQLLELAKHNNIIVFSDEMYRYLEYAESDRVSSVVEKYDNSLALFGMSKSFSLAGLRIGWLVTKNPKWIKQIIAFKDYTTICNSATSEILALIGLRSRDQILKRNKEIISMNLTLLNSFFKRFKGIFEWHEPVAGPIAFPKLRLQKEVSLFCKELVEEKGVMLLPSEVYNYPGNHFRIGFARKNMKEALNKLEEYLAIQK